MKLIFLSRSPYDTVPFEHPACTELFTRPQFSQKDVIAHIAKASQEIRAMETQHTKHTTNKIHRERGRLFYRAVSLSHRTVPNSRQRYAFSQCTDCSIPLPPPPPSSRSALLARELNNCCHVWHWGVDVMCYPVSYDISTQE